MPLMPEQIATETYITEQIIYKVTLGSFNAVNAEETF